MTEQPRTLVAGGGSWGTALAALLSRQGVPTVLWAREEEVVDGINEHEENPLFLAGVPLPASLRATSDLDQALAGADVVINAIPTQFIRSVFASRADFLTGASLLISVSKGVEVGTLLTPSEVFEDIAPCPVTEGLVALSGPSFANEVARGTPTAVVVASRVPDNARRARDLVSSETFRAYSSDDLIGVEMGGALKNVMAIAAGIADGLGTGHNTRAAVITRGLAELARLGVAKGGHPLTFAGLSGIGDLVLTCTGDLSRNRRVGFEIGRGRTLEEITAETNTVAEGVKTTLAARDLAQRLGVEMPITEQVYLTLYEDKDPRQVMMDLMTRQLRDEREDS
ncbi:MAG TPA: NAD(P)H-dependent glycerol-3-phosphate dehydrogenase [Acidimicrobiia bacterium]|nr:NAD(P)H-dependent glycerol-3-phosphate dehydrogenase [Acidimicrobiia bacterium]